METLSAYHVNSDGIFCYAGLPTMQDGIKLEHHNGVQFCKFHSGKSYEVWAVTQFGLVHGIDRSQENMTWIEINNCLRVFKK